MGKPSRTRMDRDEVRRWRLRGGAEVWLWRYSGRLSCLRRTDGPTGQANCSSIGLTRIVRGQWRTPPLPMGCGVVTLAPDRSGGGSRSCGDEVGLWPHRRSASVARHQSRSGESSHGATGRLRGRFPRGEPIGRDVTRAWTVALAKAPPCGGVEGSCGPFPWQPTWAPAPSWTSRQGRPTSSDVRDRIAAPLETGLDRAVRPGSRYRHAWSNACASACWRNFTGGRLSRLLGLARIG